VSTVVGGGVVVLATVVDGTVDVPTVVSGTAVVDVTDVIDAVRRILDR